MKKFFSCIIFVISIFFINPVFAFTEDYPVITEIETKVLGKNYSQENIYNRLDRLETNLYGQPLAGNLSDRVDKLSSTVLNDDKDSSSDNAEETYSSSESSESTESFNDLLSDLEQKLLNQSFSGDTEENRIARLEKAVFNNTSDGYTTKERIDRIAAVIKAQPSGDLFKDTAQLHKYQTAGQGIALIALILMIIASIAL